ncbi:MAG: hypothetical protein PHE25_00175 [Candidatus Gracilibacteria bacterium]|nr:hypothetical protein [Candidatus Gracilibacteria bacterium]
MTYNDLINIDDFEKRETFNPERGDVAFYCKDCEEIVQTERKNPNGYIFICKKCSGTNVAVGTLAGLKENYRIKG